MKRGPRSTSYTRALSVGFVIFFTQEAARSQGIPEPGLVIYGEVQGDGPSVQRVTSGLLTFELRGPAGERIKVASSLTNVIDQFSFVAHIPGETSVAGFSKTPDTLPMGSVTKTYAITNTLLNGRPINFVVPGGPTVTYGPADRGKLVRVDLRTPGGGETFEEWSKRIFKRSVGRDADEDGDTLSNFGEYIAGTNPDDPRSAFAFVEVQKADAGTMLRWSSAPGRRYAIRRSDSLLQSPGSFEKVTSGILATPPVNTWVDASDASAQRFYLVEIE